MLVPMPIIKSAKKALRSSAKKRARNLEKKRAAQAVLKKYKKLIAAKDKDGAASQYKEVQKKLDKLAKSGFIKKNTASRRKARFQAMLGKI